jgi:hypothetical protein
MVGSDGGDNIQPDRLDPGLIISVGPGGTQLGPGGDFFYPKITTAPNGTEQEFVSFSEPVDQVYVSGYGGAFAIEGFTTTKPEHVPDGGSTVVLLAAGLLGLVVM